MSRRALPVLAALAACSPLDRIAPGTCGNGVIEAGEDCDRFVARAGEGLVCAPVEHATPCRYVCDVRTGESCPSGWACGGDGVCRAASGSYRAAVGSPLALEASETFTFADVDGDGLRDIVASSGDTVTVGFAAREGGFPDHLQLQVSGRSGPITAAHLDDGESADLVIPVALGVLVSTGRRDRSFGPIAYPQEDLSVVGAGVPASTRVIPVRTPVSTPAHELLRLITMQDGANLSLTFNTGDRPDFFPGGGRTVDTLVGRLAVADLNVDGTDELALAFEGAGEVTIFTSTCAEFPPPACSPEIVLYAPAPHVAVPGGTGAYGVRFTDYDGDGALDLLVAMDGGEHLGLARGGPAGTLAASATRELALDQSQVRWPLAAGDLDLDGVADYIGEFGLLLSSNPGVLESLRGLALDAVIGDFNRDDLPDFAVANQGRGIDLYLGTGTRLFNPTRLATTGQVRLLRTGDFDGDFVDDIAYVEEVAAGPVPDTRLSITYGNLQGGPSRPVAMGTINYITDVEPGFLRDGDLISDLAVESAEAIDGTGAHPLSVLAGTSLRRMLSPLALAQPGESIGDNPVGLHVGRFFGGPALDLVVPVVSAFGPREPDTTGYGVWLVEGSGNAEFDRAGAVYLENAVLGDCMDALAYAAPTSVTSDLDGDGTDEVIAFAWTTEPAIVVHRVRDAGSSPTLECTRTALPPDSFAFRLLVGDIDLDEAPDVVLVGGNAFSSPMGAEQTVVAVIAWGLPGSPGRFDTNLAQVTIPGVNFATSAALLNADDDGDLEVAIATPEGIFLAHHSGRVLTTESTPVLPQTGFFTTPLIAQDVNGDGLADLAFGDPSRVDVFLAVPKGEEVVR